ncbi:MAG TPA: hypothetical protein VJ724_09700, partial [Tahibacter sp.]|nr:hypothetical protein [Tahibacter sp.]
SLATIDNGATVALTLRVDTAVANAAYPLTLDVMTGPGGQPRDLVASFAYDAADAQHAKTVTVPSTALAGGALVVVATDAAGNTSETVSRDAIFADPFDS